MHGSGQPENGPEHTSSRDATGGIDHRDNPTGLDPGLGERPGAFAPGLFFLLSAGGSPRLHSIRKPRTTEEDRGWIL